MPMKQANLQRPVGGVGGGEGGQRSDTKPGRQAAIDAAVTSPTRRIRGVRGGAVTRPRGGPWGRGWGRESRGGGTISIHFASRAEGGATVPP